MGNARFRSRDWFGKNDRWGMAHRAWLRAEGFARFPVVALLPGVVYGPGPPTEGNLVGGMMRQYLSGRFPGLLGSGEQRWSFAYIAEVVQAHLAALEKGRPGEEYFLAGDNRSLNDLFRVIGRLTGVTFPVRHLSFTTGKAFGALEVARARLFNHRPILTPGVVDIFKKDWVYSGEKAGRVPEAAAAAAHRGCASGDATADPTRPRSRLRRERRRADFLPQRC